MKLNLQKISEYLIKNGLMSKPFESFEAHEIKSFFEVVFDCLEEPNEGWTPPYEKNNELIIPFNSPLKYRWWAGGQSIMETLIEIGASDELKRKYAPVGEGAAKEH